MTQTDPTTVAVTTEDFELTWTDLDRWSNRLARMLIQRGARRGARIAMAVATPIEAAVTRAAITKTGAIPAPAADDDSTVRADLGVTTRAQRRHLGAAIDWLVLDDRSTLLGYLTGSDAPLGDAGTANKAA
ncbi:AMP-binding protein [Nocardia blacklockiae]|uniref:AMP-binding protein n=1 Tax=Nocardia blacklockiae TaxID=480036 RepID=UPI0018934DD5|nr:AMP-binding protein [Nocardia blacklockiae]MBF6171853.1 AMP-binding protein [Nocardia blacklockiae]